ncbi:hypothetical protein J6590_006207 [Homalodisca vitripennis]|nr:hypothetical protein J6590_006207 [Homalodisca vitripennis]
MRRNTLEYRGARGIDINCVADRGEARSPEFAGKLRDGEGNLAVCYPGMAWLALGSKFNIEVRQVGCNADRPAQTTPDLVHVGREQNDQPDPRVNGQLRLSHRFDAITLRRFLLQPLT